MALNSRQRVILSFLAKQNGPVGHTAMMKWLFLFSRKHPNSISSYDFVPYKYGPYSFEAHQNIKRVLARYIEEIDGGYRLHIHSRQEIQAIISRVHVSEQQTVDTIWSNTHGLSVHELVSSVYKIYPWYASRSNLQPATKEIVAVPAIYTIGYEGRSVDKFFNLLMQKGIEGVLDVRRNAYSHKYGFVGHTLKEICCKLDMKYTHLPALGIASELRKNLNKNDDYGNLFADYEQQLPNQIESLTIATDLIKNNATVLLCFEAKPECCHRGKLAPHLASRLNLPVIDM